MSEQTERNKALVRRYQDAYNASDLDVLDELLAPDWKTNAFPTAVLEQTVENAKAVHGSAVAGSSPTRPASGHSVPSSIVEAHPCPVRLRSAVPRFRRYSDSVPTGS